MVYGASPGFTGSDVNLGGTVRPGVALRQIESVCPRAAGARWLCVGTELEQETDSYDVRFAAYVSSQASYRPKLDNDNHRVRHAPGLTRVHPTEAGDCIALHLSRIMR